MGLQDLHAILDTRCIGYAKFSITLVGSSDDGLTKMTPHIGFQVLFCGHFLFYPSKSFQSITEEI